MVTLRFGIYHKYDTSQIYCSNCQDDGRDVMPCIITRLDGRVEIFICPHILQLAERRGWTVPQLDGILEPQTARQVAIFLSKTEQEEEILLELNE